jgi:TRAP-type mannitol/chloroaromatic compound transport system substrate-binding protein
MDRREFLKSTAAAAAGVTTATAATETTLAAPELSQGRQLRLAMPWADAVAGPADQAHRLCRRIAQATGERLTVVPCFEVADGLAALRADEADLYFASAHDHVDAHRGFAYFAGLPGDRGLSPQHLQTWISLGGGQALWDELAGDLGIKPLLAAHTGSRSYLVANERIGSMAALSGRKAHVAGLARDVARGLGLEPVNIAPAQLSGALRRGEILAAECGGAIINYALDLHATAHYWSGTSIHRNGTALSLAIRRDVWDRLSDSDQAALTAAAAAEYQLSLAEEDAHRHMLCPGPTPECIWPLAAELSHAIRRVADAVVAHAAGADAQTRRINDSYAACRKTLPDLGPAPAVA